MTNQLPAVGPTVVKSTDPAEAVKPPDPAAQPGLGRTLSLVDKYRPRRFDEVVGQETAVEFLKRCVLNGGHAQSIMLVGPPGTGKTTLARIYMNARLCEHARPEPCGRCQTCRGFADNRGDMQMMEYNASEFRDHATSAFVASLGRTVPWGEYYVFIDEVQGLEGASADALLKSAEEPARGAFYILATSQPKAVRSALISRCTTLQLKPLKQAPSFGMLTDICGKERITFEPSALHMVASRCGGYPRELIKTLDQVSSYGHVTAALVANVLAMDWTASLLGYFRSLIACDVSGQDEALAEWLAEPAEKARCIKEFLLYLHNYEVARPALSDVVNAAFHQITAEERVELVAAFRLRAQAERMRLDTYWLNLMAFWNGQPQFTDEVSFAIARRQFNLLANPPDLDPVSPSALPPPALSRTRAFRSRSRHIPTASKGKNAERKTALSADGYLDRALAESIYDAATFVVQAYEAPYNCHLTLRHGPLGAGDERSAGKLVSTLTHELGLRLRDWGSPAQDQHWQYAHRSVAGAVVTDLALHIPIDHGPRLLTWLRQRLASLRPMHTADAWSCTFPEAEYAHAPNGPESRMKRHWLIVRHLWASLDPERCYWDATGQRALLIDLLGVPRDVRGPAGRLTLLRRIGTSRTLGPDRRRRAAIGRMPFLSAFKDGAWGALFSGWELDEYRDRGAELDRRNQERDLVVAEFPGRTELEAKRRTERLAKLEASYTNDPHDRRRSWVGWWSE